MEPQKSEQPDLSQQALKTAHDPRIQQSFHHFSRYVIFVPLIVVVGAVLLQLYQQYVVEPRERIRELQSQLQTPTPVPTADPMQGSELDLLESLFQNGSMMQGLSQEAGDATSSAGVIDLEGPLTCSYIEDDGTQLEAYVQNNKAYAQLHNPGDIDNLLFVDDCIYKWKEGQTQGDQLCGVSSYLSLMQTFSMFDSSGGGQQDVFALLPQLGLNIASDEASLQELRESCVESPVDESVFTQPIGVIFTEQDVNGFGM